MKQKKWLIPVLSFLGTYGCVRTANVDYTLALSNSFLSVILFAAFVVLLGKVLENTYSRKDWIVGGAGALFMSIALGFGRQLDQLGSVKFLSFWLWLAIFCLAAFLTPLMVWAFSGIDWLRERLACETKGIACSKKGFFLTAAGLLLCWIPVWLAAYPGFFAYDATDELNQVLTGEYVTRHPLLHVLMLGGTVSKVYELSGSWNAGIVVFEIFQMILMSCVFSWLLQTVKKMGAPRIVIILSFLFLGLFPVVSVFVLCTTKDTLYCAGMLAVLILLWRLVSEGQKKKIGYWTGLAFALSAMAIFRNNGFYVFLVMIPVMLWMAGKKNWKKMTVCALLALVLTKGSTKVLDAVLLPQDTGVQETLTVPIQQMTRAYIFSPELYSEEEKEVLYEILPEKVLLRYNPKLSDMVKIDFQTDKFNEDPGKYISLWAKVGLRAPFTYINAWLMTSYGFWYPDTIIDVYNGQRYYTQSSYFSFETEEPGYRESRLPLLEKVYKKFSWEILQQRFPALSMLFSPGFMCWIYMFGVLYLLARGQVRELAAFGPVYLNWLTVLLGPTYLVRYVLIFWFALPLFVWLLLKRPDEWKAQQ